MLTKTWTEKFRPKTIDDLIFPNEQDKLKITEMINNKSFPHLLLYGPPGTGKTSLINVIVHEMDINNSMQVLRINGSLSGIDDIRNNITSFLQNRFMSLFNIVIIEEADRMLENTQQALNNLIEEYEDLSRFFFTTNHINKILPAIRSRCSGGTFAFKHTDKDMFLEKICNILIEEGVDETSIAENIDNYVEKLYPQMRDIVHRCQSSVVDNKLLPLTSLNESLEENLLNVIGLISNKQTQNALLLYQQTFTDSDDMDILEWCSKHLDVWKNIDESIILIARTMRAIATAPFKHIEIMAMLISLNNLQQE